MASNRAVGVGVFVVSAIALFGLALFMIGDRRMAFARKFEVSAEFSKLAGLEPGAPVLVSGMKAGEVASIGVPSTPGKFRVVLKIRRDLQPIVRADSVASIQTEGLVGNTFLQVSAGTSKAPPVAPGGTIPSREPVTFADMVQQMGEAAQTMNGTLRSVRGDVQDAVRSVSGAAERAGSIVADVGKAAGSLAEDAEALKHNFLFRGFFKDRGYFDLASISPADYRAGALTSKNRGVLRTWLPADALFRRGQSTLTPDGKRRLDAAIGEWMQFRGEGPLMVEGYSSAAAAHDQYLVSRARAESVEKYLTERFQLDPKSTGFIALGADARDREGGGPFDGIALALYLDKKTLEQANRQPKATSGRLK